MPSGCPALCCCRKWTSDINQCSTGSQVGTNRLNVQSMVGLFYMLMLAAAAAIIFASAERILALYPGITRRLRRVTSAGDWRSTALDCLLASPACGGLKPSRTCLLVRRSLRSQPIGDSLCDVNFDAHSGHHFASVVGNKRYVPDHDFSQSTLEISRSFRPRGCSLGGPGMRSAVAAAAAVAAADARAAASDRKGGGSGEGSCGGDGSCRGQAACGQVSFENGSGITSRFTTPDSTHHNGSVRGGTSCSGGADIADKRSPTEGCILTVDNAR